MELYLLERATIQDIEIAMNLINDGKQYLKEQGKWKSNSPYAVIHRLAICKEKMGNGLSATIISLVEKLCKEKKICSIRVDTDKKNTAMQHILKKNKFVYCGTVWFVDSDKLAFEKIINKKEDC